MAKRKRLTPASVSTTRSASSEGSPLPSSLANPLRAPIAHVAGDAASSAALEEVTQAFQAARDEGRLLLSLPLESIDADHLIRDRLCIDDEDMASLVTSLRERGQQVPIEVLQLENGRYGLISGWRRIQALRQLKADTVLAVVRQPDTAADAYLAMVEENEIRVGLSYFERARIAAKAAEMGLYPSASKAVLSLFNSASRAKRSKINSFVTLHNLLGDVLTYPTAIAERLGLALVAKLDKSPDLTARLKDRLRKSNVASAEKEINILTQTLSEGVRKEVPPKTASEEIVDGVFLKTKAGRAGLTLTLSGKAVTPELQASLAAWLRQE